MTAGEEKIKTKGSDGEKEVVYTVLVDENGNEISREKKSETIIKEAKEQVVERGTYEETSTGVFVLWIICLIVAFYTAFKYKKGNLLLNKIQKQNKNVAIILYLLYIITVIPAFIDIVIIIVNKIKKLKNKKNFI